MNAPDAARNAYGNRKEPPRKGWLSLNDVRRRPTLPHPGECSTIGAEGLSFRVRNGTGRFPFAMTAVTLSNSQTRDTPAGGVRVRGSGTAQWTRSKSMSGEVVGLLVPVSCE